MEEKKLNNEYGLLLTSVTDFYANIPEMLGRIYAKPMLGRVSAECKVLEPVLLRIGGINAVALGRISALG